MSGVSGQGPNNFRFADGYSEKIAAGANTWAWIEFELHWMIWELSEVNPSVGLCLTAQMFTFDAKMNALLALLTLREAPESFVKKVHAFMESTRGAQEARNRLVHDVWVMDNRDASRMGRLKMSARRKLDFSVQSYAISEIDPEVVMLERSRQTSTALRRELVAMLPTLRKIPLEAPHPLEVVR